jgi:hypothetical protein
VNSADYGAETGDLIDWSLDDALSVRVRGRWSILDVFTATPHIVISKGKLASIRTRAPI